MIEGWDYLKVLGLSLIASLIIIVGGAMLVYYIYIKPYIAKMKKKAAESLQGAKKLAKEMSSNFGGAEGSKKKFEEVVKELGKLEKNEEAKKKFEEAMKKISEKI